MPSTLSAKPSLAVVTDSISIGTAPAVPGAGVDLAPLKEGSYAPKRVAVLIRKGTSANAGDITVTGPAYVSLLIRDNWYRAGVLNSGGDITLSDGNGWVERIEDAGLATRVSFHAAADMPADNQVTVELANIDDPGDAR